MTRNVGGRETVLAAAIASLFAGSFATAVSATPVDFPDLPMPPKVEMLTGLPETFPSGRDAYLDRLTSVAEEFGLPPALADAVAYVESAYQPDARGADGEVGLMQILPGTAKMLGHSGSWAELLNPDLNIRYGVRYLAKAWQLAGGDLCRTLMKYRAGHGEERMSALSVRYCARARAHLASMGSPLAAGFGPVAEKTEAALAASAAQARRQAGRGGYQRGKIRTAAESRRFWAAHEARIRAINARLAGRPKVASGG